MMIKKMKDALLLISLLCAGIQASSQLTILNTFMPKNVRYENTWQASITNPIPGTTLTVHAELEITKNRQEYLKAVSEKFALPNGITQIDFNTIRIAQILYNAGDITWNQFLTFGEYEVCLRIITEENGPKGEGCIPIEVLPISPPVIISPEDNAELGTFPIFSWSPPVPMNIFKNICYTLKIVPVYDGQSGYEAMSRNNPVYTQPCIPALSFIYGIDGMPLENGQQYAWQITADDEGAIVGKSEVQTFKVNTKEEKPKEYLIPDYYYKLKRTDDGNFGTAKGCIGFTSEEEKLDSAMKFKIYDSKNKALSCTDKLKMKKVGDENYFILELIDCNEIRAKETYRLEVISPTNNKYMILFKYSEPETK